MAIKVVNKRTLTLPDRVNNCVIYCGRGSALGNPFHMRNERERDCVCDQYADYLPKKVSSHHSGIVRQLEYIVEKAKKGDVFLECYCAPKRCHCDTIKEYVETYLL